MTQLKEEKKKRKDVIEKSNIDGSYVVESHCTRIARIRMMNDAVEGGVGGAIKQAIDQQHPKLRPPFIFSHLSDIM